MSLLAPYRALDLTDDRGFLCGKLLADLGAEVLKVERPGGDPCRLTPPLYQDTPHPERSLYWWAYNQGKKGITLNLKTPEGKELFLQLVATSHWVIESFPPGYMEELGLGYEALSQASPAIILTRISPFGQTGPYRDYKARDLVAVALGGAMYLYGDPDRPPVRISFPQAYLHAGAEAAVGSLMALYHRQRTGQGQVVDVSIREAVIPATFNALPWWELQGVALQRQGPRRPGLSSGAIQRQTWPCRNGFVSFIVFAGATGANTNKALVEWMDSEGMADDFLKGIDWDSFDMVTANQDFHDKIEERVGRFFLAHTKEELYEEAIRRRMMLYPVADIPDIAHNPQLQARGFWVQVEHPELNARLTYPGLFVRSYPIPLQIGRCAPLIGEHNREIYLKLGLSPERIEQLKERGVV